MKSAIDKAYSNRYINVFIRAVLAGVFISMGCILYLNNRNVGGAIVFAIGIMLVITHGAKLCTGMFGFKQNKVSDLITAIFGNFVGTFVIASIYSSNNSLKTIASEIVVSKFSHNVVYVFLSAILCGILITSSVLMAKEMWKTVMCIAAFIMMGADHCVANFFYLFLSGCYTWRYVGMLLLCIVGNAVGSILLSKYIVKTVEATFHNEN